MTFRDGRGTQPGTRGLSLRVAPVDGFVQQVVGYVIGKIEGGDESLGVDGAGTAGALKHSGYVRVADTGDPFKLSQGQSTALFRFGELLGKVGWKGPPVAAAVHGLSLSMGCVEVADRLHVMP